MRTINSGIELIKENIDCEDIRIYHFCKDISNINKDIYSLNIICCEFKHLYDLKNNWNTLSENVALYVQSKLEKVIELYNVYIIFFTTESDDNLFYEIEQDKYSSRKIVINSSMPWSEEEVKTCIDNRLFKFCIEGAQRHFCLDNEIKKYDEKFYKYIKTNEITEESVDKIINSFGGDSVV